MIQPNAKEEEDIFWEKTLNSTSGTLEITKIELGEFSSIGVAEGHISGTFSFSGYAFPKKNPGSASGEFKSIPLMVVH